MAPIEFVTRIEDGKIEVPEQLRGQSGVEVRVLVYVQKATRRPDILDRLFQQPLAAFENGFLSREEIYGRPVSG